MEDNHVDLKMKVNKNADSIFILFNDLTGENNENPKYCWALTKSLLRKEFNVGSGNSLEYSVKRLLRGMGSSRLYAQCGCFAALTCILKYQAGSVETVLEILEKEQKPPPGATKSEMKTLASGCVLTCGAIIHSGLFNSQKGDVQEKILKKLVEAGKKKSYLMPVLSQFLIDVVNLSDKEKFRNIVWPICELELFQNLNDCNADIFSLFLACLKKDEKVISKFLQLNSMTSEVLFETIIKCLFNSSIKYDHSVYDSLGQFFCMNPSSLVKSWTKCVDENANINIHKDAVLITVFSYVIKNLQNTSVVPKLLTPKFIGLFIQILSSKKTKKPKDDFIKMTKFALNSVITLLCSATTSEETRFQSIKKLLFYPANLKFEMKTGTKCIYTLASKMSCEFIKKLVDIYKQVINGEFKKKIDENGTEENWNSKEKQHALHVFTKTLSHPSLKKEINWKLCKIKYIFEISFLKKHQLPSEVQKCAKDCFFKAIMVQMPSLKELLLFLDELALFVNDNITNKELKASKEIEDLWNKMYSVVETLKKKLNNKLFAAVHVLLIYMGLHLFVDYELAKGGIEELLSCYQHLREAQKIKKSEVADSLHWTEVTVDLILSLLSRENRLWRHVVSCVFPQVVPQITPTALQQIIDALDPKSQNLLLNHLSSDDSDAESEEESNSSLSEAEESDLEAAQDEEKPNDQLRSAVRNALGYSAANTDDESVDMDQMNEEEERRLNESLSEAFRQFKSKSRSKNKKQTKEEEALTHFRLRVLDLIEIFITNSPSMGGCLDLLFPLFDLLEASIRDHHLRPLQNRVDSILKHISAVKTFSSVENVSQAIIKDVFQSVISRKETSALVFVEMSPRISDCTAFLVRCSQQVSNEDADTDIPLVDEYNSLLKAFFQSRDFKLPISTFQAVLRMSWKGNFRIVATLFQLLVCPSVRIFKKVKIIELLRIFYKNDKLHGSCDDTSKSELKEVETNFVYNFINFMADYDKNNSKSTEKMYLSFFSNIIMLITVIQSCSKRHRTESNREEIPPWKILVSKMVDTEVIISNKKTRSQLANLANTFKVELPTSEKFKRKRTLSETSFQAEEVKENEESEGKEQKKKNKKLSAEKRKLKEESRKLREEISSNGLATVRFSSVDFRSLPEPEIEDEEENQSKFRISPKKRKKDFNQKLSV